MRTEFSRVSRTDRRRSRDMSRDRDSTVPDARTARSVTLPPPPEEALSARLVQAGSEELRDTAAFGFLLGFGVFGAF